MTRRDGCEYNRGFLPGISRFADAFACSWNTIANKYKMAEPASIKRTYIQVLSLLAKERITYELLWAIFPPNSNVYTKCLVTGAPQCVRYDSCEEREAPLGAESYNITCHYLDSDAGKAWLDITIPKFSGTKSICTLEAFPLLYHPDAEALTTYFVQCGRTFVSIHRPHHCFYPGPMFYMNQGALVEKHITSCVVLDSCGRALGQIEDSDDIDPTELEEKDLLICSPIVPGFALEDELWGIFVSLLQCGDCQADLLIQGNFSWPILKKSNGPRHLLAV